MKKLIVLATALGAIALPAAASAQTEDPPPGVARVGRVEGLTQYKWQGASAVGANTTPFTGDIACGTDPTDPTTTCDVSLVEFSYPMTEEEIAAGKTSHTKTATISIRNAGPLSDPPTDLDLQVLESDANGTAGNEVDTSGDLDADWAAEAVSFSVRTTPSQPSKWYLVRVIYFASAGNAYFGQAGFDLPAGIDQGGIVKLGETFTWEGQPAVAFNHNYFGQYDVGDPPSEVPHPGGQVPPYPEQLPRDIPAPPAWTHDVTGRSDTCTKDPNTYCEQILVAYDNPLTEEEIAAGITSKKKATTIRIDQWDPPHPVTDFDLIVFESDSKGTVGNEIAQSADGITCLCTDLNYETVSFNVTTTDVTPVKWLLVRVVFFQSPRTEYVGTVTF